MFKVWRAAVAILLFSSISAVAQPAPAIPDEFTDPDTGAKMLHLSKGLEGSLCSVIYFHQPCITSDSRYVLVRQMSPQDGHTAGIMWRYDLQSHELIKLTDKMTRNQTMVPASGNLYYSSDKDRAIYVTNILTKETKKICDVPSDVVVTGGVTVNCDETLLVGTAGLAEVAATQPTLTTPPNQGSAFGDTFSRHETNILFSIDLKTGAYKEIHRINTWLGHTQFNPVDPKLLMFCHEGPWQQVDRIWSIKIQDGAQPQMVYKRQAPGEIAGHEFWSTDGSMAFFDDNYRDASRKHFLTGKNMATGALTQYPIEAEFGSIHYTPSPDGKFFVSDGGTRRDPSQQAMYILVPQANGTLKATKLCNMSKNDYKAAEPNPHTTPDQHWVVFTATLHGQSQAYAVEMPKEYWR